MFLETEMTKVVEEYADKIQMVTKITPITMKHINWALVTDIEFNVLMAIMALSSCKLESLSTVKILNPLSIKVTSVEL